MIKIKKTAVRILFDALFLVILLLICVAIPFIDMESTITFCIVAFIGFVAVEKIHDYLDLRKAKRTVQKIDNKS